MGRIVKAGELRAAGTSVKAVRLGGQTGAAGAKPMPQPGAAVCRPEASTTMTAGFAADFERARQVLQEVTDRLLEHDQRLAERAGNRLIDLAVAIARRILRDQVELDPTVVQRAVREALEEASRAQEIEVRVNPRDLPATQAATDTLFEVLGSVRGLTVVPDPQVAPGGVVLHTDVGIVDGQIETQLTEVRAALVDLGETEPDAGRER